LGRGVEEQPGVVAVVKRRNRIPDAAPDAASVSLLAENNEAQRQAQQHVEHPDELDAGVLDHGRERLLALAAVDLFSIFFLLIRGVFGPRLGEEARHPRRDERRTGQEVGQSEQQGRDQGRARHLVYGRPGERGLRYYYGRHCCGLCFLKGGEGRG